MTPESLSPAPSGDLDLQTTDGTEIAGARTRQIVDAAYRLLDEEGLDGLTIRAVLARTGLSRRAFYERFVGKDELMLAVFEHALRLAALLYGDKIGGIADPLERLKLIVTGIVLGRTMLGVENGASGGRFGAAMSREHLRLAQTRPQELQDAVSPLLTLIAQQLSDGMATGQVRAASPERLAALVYNFFSSTVHQELMAQEAVPPDPADLAKLADEIWEFCRRAIAV